MAAAEHDHAGHAHGNVTADTDTRRLATALGLILAFMAVEVVVGIVVHSLALLSDAAHMLTDAGALGLSLIVIRLVARPAGRRPHLRPEARRDPVRAGQRLHAARPRRADRLRRASSRLISPPAAKGCRS